jgi:hypothetical protein
MAEIRVYIQPRLPAASSQTAFYDFSRHVEFDSLDWEQNDQGNASRLSANIYSIMPVSTTHWLQYAGATQADKIQNALYDQFYHLKIYPRTEIQIRDVSTSPHTILWGGVVTRVSENRDGGAIVGSLEAIDYTALLNESVALEFTPIANSTIKETITSQTYSFTPSFAQRTAGLATITLSSIAIGSPYSRNLDAGDVIVVNLSDDTYDGVHKVTGVTADGSTYKVRFQQYSNVADSVSAAVTGTVKIPGFMTTDNAPAKDSRINVNPANIANLNPDWKWSPRNPDISRAVSNVARTGTLVTITTSAQHGFGIDRVVTVNLTNGPTGYADANGSFVIASTPTDSTFTYNTVTTGTITSGAAVGTVVCAGEITPTPMKGGTLARNLQYAVERGTGCFYLNEGTLDGGGNLTIDLFVRPKNLIDLVTNGLFDDSNGTTTTQLGWDMGSWLADTTGTSGPFGVGNTIYYTGSDHQDAEMAPAYRISVTEGEKYFISWRHFSDKDNKERPRVKYYDAGGTVVGNPHGVQISQHDPLNDEWHRDWGIAIVPSGAAKMSFVLHHESFSSSYTARFTDIQFIKITGTYGFSDHPIEDTATYGMTLNTFENPSAPSESGESSNRIYVYAPYTTEDPLTGAKMLTSYRNTYDFAQGVWEAGGKRIEGSIVELNATDTETALLTAGQYFKERGRALKSFEFEHNSGKLAVGDVIPFIWDELGIAEALVVRKQSGYLIGQDVYYKVQLGGDLAFQRSTMYLVEQRLAQITGDAAYFSPPPSPYPGYPTEGGVVTPAIPNGDAGAKKVDISWEYPQSIIENASFGGFVVLRSADAGDNWVKASTGEPILTSQNPLAPDSSVPSYSDTNVEAAVNYIYKVAAVDVSGPTPILTEYSTDSEILTPTDVTVDFDDAYNGLGINVPKIVNSVTYPGNSSAATISTITSGASTTATVTTSSSHGFSTGWVVGITGAIGTNNGDVNGGFYVITVTSATQFTITKTGTNVLSLTQGTATGWQVSGDFIDDTATSRTLGDAFSLVQFPVGQIAYSEADGKLYRNGKPGTAAFNNKWTRAAVDAIDVTSDGSIVISADKITTGSLNAGRIQAGTLSLSPLSANAITSSGFTVTNAGAVTATNMNITGGPSGGNVINVGSGTFQVTSAGALTATSATITGSITATGGKIANWDIDTNSIYNIVSSSYVGLYHGTTSTSKAFFAGASDAIGTGAEFYVQNDGALVAGSFSVSSAGLITATGGYFNPSTGRSALVVDGSSTEGDLSAANSGTLHLGRTTATTTGTGTFLKTLVMDGTNADFYSRSNTLGAAIRSYTADGATFAKWTWDETNGVFVTTDVVSAPGINITGTAAQVTLPASSITTADIANSAVTAAKIASNTITAAEIAGGAVGDSELSTTAILKITTLPADVTVSARAAVWSAATGGAALRRSSGSITSERAFKKDIQQLNAETDKYESLNWISFKYDVEAMQNYGLVSAGVDYEVDDTLKWGLIADEVQSLFPEAIATEESDGVSYRGIKYETLRVIEGRVIKDLIGRVKSLEARIAELEA